MDFWEWAKDGGIRDPGGHPPGEGGKALLQGWKLVMVVEIGDRPMPFVVSAEKGALVLFVGGGTEEGYEMRF